MKVSVETPVEARVEAPVEAPVEAHSKSPLKTPAKDSLVDVPTSMLGDSSLDSGHKVLGTYTLITFLLLLFLF